MRFARLKQVGSLLSGVRRGSAYHAESDGPCGVTWFSGKNAITPH